MTKVTFYQKNGVVIGFDAWDHAGYANAGEDIICAAVSALVLNAINSIEAFTSDAFTADVKEEDGRIEFRLEQDNPSDDTTLLLKSLILGLQGIENEEENMQFAYNNSDSVKEKIEKVAKNIYGATGVEYSEKALQEIEKIERKIKELENKLDFVFSNSEPDDDGAMETVMLLSENIVFLKEKEKKLKETFWSLV